MDIIIFIGTNKSGSSREAISSAKELNLHTILLTDNKRYMRQLKEFNDVDECIQIDLTDMQKLKEIIKKVEDEKRKVTCIISFLESHVITAARLSEEFGLPGFTRKAMGEMEDKIKTRQLLTGHSMNPYFDVFTKESNLDLFLDRNEDKLPLIVKSPNSTGSNDVYRVDTKADLKKKIKLLRRRYHGTAVLIEEFLEGEQFLVEVIVKDKNPSIVAVMKQDIMPGNRFIVTGYSILPEYSKDTSIHNVVTSVTEVFQMEKGTFHIEMRFVNGVWKLVEINPRISGGAMNKMIQAHCGINTVKETIKLYLGEPMSLTKQFESVVYTLYLTVKTSGRLIKVIGKNAAESYPGVVAVYIKPRKGMHVRPPISMGQRYGYIIATADTIKEAKSISMTVGKDIKFYIQPN